MPIYMNIDNLVIPGESTTQGYERWIEISSFQWGVSETSGASHSGGRGAGKAVPSDITVTMPSIENSPKLFYACCTANVFRQIQFAFTKTAGDRLVKFEEVVVHDVLVSSYSFSSGGDRPSESISFAFRGIQMTTYVQAKDGSTTTGASESFIF